MESSKETSPKRQFDKVGALFRLDSNVRKLITHLVSHPLGTSVVYLDDLHQQMKASGGNGVLYYDLVHALKALADLSLGEFITGRRGHRTRFRGSDALNAIAVLIVADASDAGNKTNQRGSAASAASPQSTLVHKFLLRPNHELNLPLPADFNATEATRIADWVRTLPFGD